MRTWVLVFTCVAVVAATPLQPRVDKTDLLSAPWTPFNADGSVNLTLVEPSAKQDAAWGVNTIWVPGGMGQWDALLQSEREALATEWVKYGQMYGMEVLVHVGSNCIAEGVALAKHAVSLKPDGIACIPHFAPTPPKNGDVTDIDRLIDDLAPIAAASGNLPFYYYHIPGVTGLPLTLAEFLPKVTARIPNFNGVKYVDHNLTDFNAARENFPHLRLWWAGNPKIESMPSGVRAFVLAEGYYAPLMKKTVEYYNAGDLKNAQLWQDKMTNAQQIIGQNGDAKEVMSMPPIDINLGPNRLPSSTPTSKAVSETYQQLKSAGFFVDIEA